LTTSFAQRHVRSGFSYGFKVATPEELVEVLSRLDMDSLAATGKNSVPGPPWFLKAADEYGVCPVASAETQNGGRAHEEG
jgi:DNA polymerase III alpha subunit